MASSGPAYLRLVIDTPRCRVASGKSRQHFKRHVFNAALLSGTDQASPVRRGDAVSAIPLLDQAIANGQVVGQIRPASPCPNDITKAVHNSKVRYVPGDVKTICTGDMGTMCAMVDTCGERLKLVRKRKYSTPEAAAAAYGWNKHTYESHELGKRGIRRDVAQKYARAFRVSWIWLLTGYEPEVQLSPEEEMMLFNFRALPFDEQIRAIKVVEALAPPPASEKPQET